MKIWDAIIIGTGIAGLFTALNIDNSLNVLIVTKDSIDKSNSILAQGGIVSCINPTVHFEDTLKAGSYYNDKEVIRTVEKDSNKNIEKLIEYGVNFDKDEYGNLKFTREGGHSIETILYSKDITGKEIIQALIKEVKSRSNISILEYTYALEVVKRDNGVSGIITLNNESKVEAYSSKSAIVATGGVGQVYKNTTNSQEITGDGIALGYRIGANIKDMEFIQFHPTAMYGQDYNRRFLISEAVRGEGAILKNINGKPFMYKYHEMGDLAPRDVVSRGIFNEMKELGSEFVYLDITHKDGKYIKDRFPNIYNKCLESGIEITKQYIPVAPAEHYIMGGLETDLQGKTNIKGLYACGECACTGFHGANRLASNSLLEGLVFGDRVAKCINSTAKEAIILNKDIINEYENMYEKDPDYSNLYVENKIKDTMNKYVSIIRTEYELLEALEIMKSLQGLLKERKVLSRKYFELRSMTDVSLLIIKKALERKESIGSHFII